jgi:hypothetical protein
VHAEKQTDNKLALFNSHSIISPATSSVSHMLRSLSSSIAQKRCLEAIIFWLRGPEKIKSRRMRNNEPEQRWWGTKIFFFARSPEQLWHLLDIAAKWTSGTVKKSSIMINWWNFASSCGTSSIRRKDTKIILIKIKRGTKRRDEQQMGEIVGELGSRKPHVRNFIQMISAFLLTSRIIVNFTDLWSNFALA